MKNKIKYRRRFIAFKMRKMPVGAAVVLCVAVLGIFGYGYRGFSGFLEKAASAPVMLERPLGEIPLEIGQWKGVDVPISLEILKVAQNDDFVNRLYINRTKRLSANLYIPFSATPGTMLGHRPRVCFKGAGWIHDETSDVVLTSVGGREFSCLVHKFHKDYQDIYVLNFYVLNGKITTSEEGFSGISVRTPNIDGQLARYVAQVQISSDYESTVKTAAVEFIDTIMEFFPLMGEDKIVGK